MDFNKIIETVLLAILPPLFASITAYCIAYVKRYLDGKSADQRYFIEETIRIGIRAAEQIFKAGNGGVKKEYALSLIQNLLAEQGIKVDVELIEGKIEAAVYSEFRYDPKPELPKG